MSALATQGNVYVDGIYVCTSLELPWHDNARNISCIPDGVYPVRIREAGVSRKFSYRHLVLDDVEDRTGILIHRLNSPRETHGCIGVGLSRGQDVIRESGLALEALLIACDRGQAIRAVVESVPGILGG
jgi:hypothetical protein